MTDPDAWRGVLPRVLLERAYRTSDGRELAWSRSDALEVIELLIEAGYEICGVDIWLPTKPGPTIPTPFVYDWDDRHPISAAEFVKTFAWDDADRSHGGRAPYFNLTV